MIQINYNKVRVCVYERALRGNVFVVSIEDFSYYGAVICTVLCTRQRRVHAQIARKIWPQLVGTHNCK